VVPFLPVVLSWREQELGKTTTRPLNKICRSDEEEARCAPSSAFQRHQGGDLGDWMVAVWFGSRRWGITAVLCGDPKRRQAGAAVTLGQGGHSALRFFSNRGFSNLLAGVPRRRPPCVSVAATFVTSLPSGFVPGIGVDGRDLESFFGFGGEGSDCICHVFSKVLSVKVQGLLVFQFYFVALFVICNLTD